MNGLAVAGAMLRWTFYAGLLLTVGAVTIRVLARGSPASAVQADVVAALGRRSARIGASGAAAALLATFLRLPLQLAELRMPGEPLDTTMVPMLLGTNWGYAWLLQIGAGLVALGALWRARGSVSATATWAVAAAAAGALVASVGVSGHAAEGEGAVRLALFAIHVVHAGAAALWLGTLALLVGAALPASRALGTDERSALLLALLRRFSPLALAAAAVLAASGVTAGVLHVGTLPALWESGYGRLLLGKAVLALLVATMGAYHWRYAPDAVVRAGGTPLARTAGSEIVVAALVLAVTAVLVATPLPGTE